MRLDSGEESMPEEATGGILKGRTLSIGIGTRLQFQLGIKGQECKAAGILVERFLDEYLMVRAPAIPGILSKMNGGDPIVVVCLCRKCLWLYLYGYNLYSEAGR